MVAGVGGVRDARGVALSRLVGVGDSLGDFVGVPPSLVSLVLVLRGVDIGDLDDPSSTNILRFVAFTVFFRIVSPCRSRYTPLPNTVSMTYIGT